MTKGEITIKIRMLKMGFTSQQKLADLCGCTQQFIGMMISGKKTSDRVLGCMAEALGLQREKLLRLTFLK